MKKMIVGTITMLLIAGTACAADTTLWEELIDVAIQHIKTNGPDAETGQFISMARHHAWSRRQDFVDLVVPHLKGNDPEKVAGAVGVLYWLRAYHPMSYLGDFKKDNKEFLARLDKIVYGQLNHLHSLKSDQVYHRLALYLGFSAIAESKRHLLKIAKSPIAKDGKEQALICLAWHRDPKDMELLFPFMLEDSQASRSLPYHFRNSYASASVPYLKKTLSDAKSQITRLEAAFELVHLRIPAGFQYIYATALRDTKPEGKRPRPLDRIKQFARDYLELPKDVASKENIAIHIEKKQSELCERQD